MALILMITYSFILACSLMIIWHKLQNKRLNFKDKNLYISIIGITIISLLNYFLVNIFIKISIITIVFMFFFWYLFREKPQKCIITPIYYQLIIMISETMYALFLTIILKMDTEMIINSYLGTFMTNVIVALISILVAYIHFVRKIYIKIIKVSESIKESHLIMFCLFLVFISNILAMTMYYKIEFQYLMIFNVSLTLICSTIVIYSFITKNKYNKVSNKYNIAINSLKDYEEMMSKYRISNHENKNLLLAIRAMVINKEKEIPKYIDSMIKKKYTDNEKLLTQVNVIPSGGLRATIYSEIIKIQERSIDYQLLLDKGLKTIDLIELDTNVIIDICKIIGVLIDNSIEEVCKIKEKNIIISLYIEDNSLIIEVSNNFKGTINPEKIFQEGYTTKGKGHGYGLSLVKKIIDSNNYLDNKIKIYKNIITQQLIINYKKIKK